MTTPLQTAVDRWRQTADAAIAAAAEIDAERETARRQLAGQQTMFAPPPAAEPTNERTS